MCVAAPFRLRFKLRESCLSAIPGIAITAFLLLPFPAHADIARALCQAHAGLINVVMQMRMGDVPISVAENAIGSTIDVDPHLYAALYQTVRLIYANPSEMQAAISSGRWTDACARIVRGY
jgi:hypothetical protein